MHVRDLRTEMTCREHGIGELYVAGDHAWEHGDLPAITEIAEHWIEYIGEPLHCEFVSLVRGCADPELAGTRLEEKLRAETPGS
jgi:hypothetical protein